MTIGTLIVIFVVLTVFWVFLTVFDEWYTVPIVKSTQNHWCTIVTGLSRLYQQSNSVPINSVPKQSKQQKMTIGVPIVTCLRRVHRIHEVRVRRIHKAVCAYQQCCHLANENKTCPSLLVFKNNNMAHESQGFVGQSSRNSGTRVEQPSVLKCNLLII